VNIRDARRLAWALTATAIESETPSSPMWKDVPELSEADWQRVEAQLDFIRSHAHAAAGDVGWFLLNEAQS